MHHVLWTLTKLCICKIAKTSIWLPKALTNSFYGFNVCFKGSTMLVCRGFRFSSFSALLGINIPRWTGCSSAALKPLEREREFSARGDALKKQTFHDLIPLPLFWDGKSTMCSCQWKSRPFIPISGKIARYALHGFSLPFLLAGYVYLYIITCIYIYIYM